MAKADEDARLYEGSAETDNDVHKKMSKDLQIKLTSEEVDPRYIWHFCLMNLIMKINFLLS